MGRDKASLPFGEETLLGRQIRLLRDLADPIVLVAAPDQDVSAWSDGRVLVQRDRQSGLGPLEGIGRGLQPLMSRCDLAYVTSCDVPLLVREWIERLCELIADAAIAVPVEGDRHHPLAALYRPEVGTLAQELVDQGQRRPIALFDQVATLRVDVEAMRQVDPNLDSLMNLNYPEDYHAALIRAGLAPST
jgi:molybdopterin-guanine dinucleotide biosynthesis protein A